MIRKTLYLSLSLLAAAPALAAGPVDPSKAPNDAVGFGVLTYGFTDQTTNVAFLALVVFLLFVWWVGGFKLIFGALDKRADNIKTQLEEATSLRVEAEKRLAEAKQHAKEAEDLADEIVQRAKKDADALMTQAEADLQAKLVRREAQAEQRIARAEAEAETEVRRAAADAATKAAKSVLSNASEASSLFDKALNEIDGRLN